MEKMKIKSIISIFILFALVWANFNLFYFSHFHVDESGRILLHAHPFQESKTQHHTPIKHSHTKSEFFLLSFINEILSLFVFSIILSFIFLRHHPVFKIISSSPKIHINEILKGLSRRGPPIFFPAV